MMRRSLATIVALAVLSGVPTAEASSVGIGGAELVFASEDSAILQNAIVEKLHRSGKLAWGNAIQFSSQKILSARHTDDVSITASPELGWGWLIEHGFDIIQTDWVLALHTYLKTRNCALPAETACGRMETSE